MTLTDRTDAAARKILYGGDYNPEQWPREVWHEDDAAFTVAGIETLTLGVFDWAQLQPSEHEYDFSQLDAIIEHVVATGRSFVLATATGALPPWLAHQHPEVTRVDFQGRKHKYGQRHNHCPNSPVFRRLSPELAGRLAERYGNHPQLVAWHIGNEYGGFDGGCWCDNCGIAYRLWLQERYGSLDELNRAWNATFWSHTYGDWDEIVPPNILSEHWRGPNHTAFQGNTLDYLRFMSDSMLRNYLDEKAAIRAHDTTTPATTNFMGLFRPLDYQRWAEHLDFVSWDNYPPGDREHARMALTHDLMRGLKQGDPFWVMEQTPTITASRDVNPVKRPGVLRLWSWQSVAHGADAVLYFQMRQSPGACEKYHGALLDHAGRTDTRSFREAAALGAEFAKVGDALLGARTPARAALLFDWNSWWASEMTDGLNRHLTYPAVVQAYHRALWQAGVDLDLVSVHDDLDGYDLVIAPQLHLVQNDIADRLRAVVERGGTVVASALSGRVDASDNAFLGDAPGPFGSLFGLRVEETDSLPPGEVNGVRWSEGVVGSSSLVFELIVPEGAEAVAAYEHDFYAGRPVVTRNAVGDGEAWYVAAHADDAALERLFAPILERHDLVGPYAAAHDLEFAVREGDGGRFAFLLHHGLEPVEVVAHASGVDLLTDARIERGQTLTIAPRDVIVLRED